MKCFAVYRNIRKRALIFGLPVALFALQMVGVIGALLIIIFSFSFLLLLAAAALNAALYVFLLKLTHQPHWVQVGKVFPHSVSHKKTTAFTYED